MLFWNLGYKHVIRYTDDSAWDEIEAYLKIN